MKRFAFTIDLEADYDGVISQYGIFKEAHKIDEFLSVLSCLDVKITVFTVGKILALYPDIIKIFEKYNCEFEPHSYSHDINSPDSESEIIKVKEAYLKYFNKSPRGYRAPRGKISYSGIKFLEKHGFLYDSSIFPSYFPDPLKYLFADRTVHYYKDSGIMEIPFTSLSPLRVALSISYIKLLGIDFYTKLPLPDFVCFGSHLHDFIINDESFNKLPLVWKLIYSRNKYSGIDLCIKYLEHVKRKGFEFCYMSEIYSLHKK